MKISEFNQTISYLLRPKPKMQVADLVDDLQPGPLKDELLKDFDPSQQTYEEYLRDKGLGERPFNAQNGGRVIPSRQELKIIANELAEELGKLPTQTQVAKKAGIAIQTVRNRLIEGIDFAKPLSKLEAGKLGGRKVPDTAVTTINDNLLKKFKSLKNVHISPSLETSQAGSKNFRVKFTGPIKNDFKDFSLPATEQNFKIIKEKIDDVVTSNVYKNKAKVFKTPEDFRALKRLKESIYRKKDPFGVYEKLRRFKAKVFPGDFSKDIQIQHGQPKFTTQSLNKFGFIDKDVNVSPAVEFTERIRNEEVGKLLNRLKTKRPLEIKKSLIEDFNNKMKALKGQLKGTKGQGLVNFELFKIDNQGKVSKLKDVGFNPKKGLVASDEDLSKITKERADQLIKEGKNKILKEGYRRGFLDKAGKVLKGAGKVIKPIGYAFGANAVKSAISQADEINLDLSPVDLFMALDSGDASVALNNARRRVDPEFAAQERAKDLARLKDDFEEVGLDDIGMQEYTEDYKI